MFPKNIEVNWIPIEPSILQAEKHKPNKTLDAYSQYLSL